MTIKSIQTLVSEAMQEIKTINANEALKMVEDNSCNLIDIRDQRELEKTGKVENDTKKTKKALSGNQFYRSITTQICKTLL